MTDGRRSPPLDAPSLATPAHVVYVTNGMSSTLNSSLELSRRLVEAGHRLTYVSKEDLGEVVSAHGHGWVRLRADVEMDQELEDLTPPWKSGGGLDPLRWMSWVRRRRELRARSARMSEFEGVLRRLDPDLVLVDMELHAAVLTVLSMDFPVFLVIVWFSVFFAPELPPMNTKLLPPTDLGSRLKTRWAWSRTWLQRGRTEWAARLGSRGLVRRLQPVEFDTLNVDDLKAVARARGVDRSRQTSRRHWLWPWVYPELPVLSFNLWELEFPHEPQPNLHYVGPMVARERIELRTDPASREAWDGLLERRKAGPDRPLVYCSLGSHWSADLTLLKKIVEAVRRRPDWDLVIGLGGKLAPEALDPLPDNVTPLTWAPQLEILAQSSACITHGGITSINECIAFGVPMVVFSTEQIDQDGCAARVEYHGIGLREEREYATEGRVRGMLETVLTDPDFRARVAALQQRLLELERERPAVSLVEEARGVRGA